MDRTITMIPASRNPITSQITTSFTKRRVAGYARVSTDSEEQLTSYEAQVDYYTQYINNDPRWEFVDVYTDEGITATNTKHRKGFNRMIEDALDGKIDLIVTKSISRFARNTVDSLVTIRKLKEKGVEVYFQKENLWTFDGNCEVVLTLMAALAQEESRSISENVTWAKRKSAADGKVSLPYKKFLGFKKGADGLPEVVPEEAEIVVKIYRLFMQGKTPIGIANILTEEGFETPGNGKKWHSSTIDSILINEKYKGAALLQKRFTVDFLQKKIKINEGEVPQYYIEHSHDAIIYPEEWQAVQDEIQRRKAIGKAYSGKNVFAGKFVCGECGGLYGRKVMHSNSKYRCVKYQCNGKYKGEHRCETPTLTEKDIKKRFLIAMNRLIQNKEEITENLLMAKQLVADFEKLDDKIQKEQAEIAVVSELVKYCIEQNAKGQILKEEYKLKYDEYEKRYNETFSKIEKLKETRAKKKMKADRIEALIQKLNDSEEVFDVFDESLWILMVEKVIAYNDGRLVFRLYSGLEIEA